MNLENATGAEQPPVPGRLDGPTDRRRFLQWSGAAAAGALLIACDKSPTDPAGDSRSAVDGMLDAARADVTIDLSDDIGILNFAYALEQLEAAYYATVAQNLYPGASGEEQKLLLDIKNHEVIHREFFAAALGGAAIPKLKVDFSSVDFDSRNAVWQTAQALEDTGVGAYNGAAQFIRRSDYLTVAGKIVSVEARHASAIRDVLGRNFAPQAFDPAFSFEQVLRKAGPFIATKIAITRSPTARIAAQTADLEMDS